MYRTASRRLALGLLVALLALLAVAAPARADVQLTGVPAWSQGSLNTPELRRYGCAATALAMICSYYGSGKGLQQSIDLFAANHIISLPYGFVEQRVGANLVGAVGGTASCTSRVGWGDENGIRAQLNAGNPVSVWDDAAYNGLGHHYVVVGYDAGGFWIIDPNGGIFERNHYNIHGYFTFSGTPAHPQDGTPPTTPVVQIGSAGSDAVQVRWSSSDPESGIAEYRHCVGSSPGGSNVRGWTSVGTSTQAAIGGIDRESEGFFVSVQARNGAGLWSASGVSPLVQSFGLPHASIFRDVMADSDSMPPWNEFRTLLAPKGEGFVTAGSLTPQRSFTTTTSGLVAVRYLYTVSGRTTVHAYINGQELCSRHVNNDGDGAHTRTDYVFLPAGDHKLRFGVYDGDAYIQGVSAGILVLDTTPPTTTASGADKAWHRRPVTISFSAVDNEGGSGVASTEYQLDGGAWTAGTSLTLSAPADHSGDGTHTVAYRSSDMAGNLEVAKSLTVKIDTTGPVTYAKAVTGRKGKRLRLRYKVTDNLSRTARAVRITVKNRRGKVVKVFKLGSRACGTWHSAVWCSKARGSYRYSVTARDLAGNAPRKIGWAKVVVK